MRHRGKQSWIVLLIAIELSAFGVAIAAPNERAVQVANKDALAESLKSANPQVRYGAARSIARLGSKAQPAIEPLIAALKDFGAPVEPDLQYAGPRVRDAAADALAQIGRPAVPALVQALTHKEAAVREAAARSLGKIGPPAQEAFPALKSALADSQDWVCWSVVRAIGRVGQQPKVVVPLLAEVFRDGKEHGTRLAALEALHDADPGGTFAIPVLVKGLKNPDGDLMGAAAQTLGQYGANAKSAVPALTKALQSNQQRWEMHFDMGFTEPARIDVARALGAIGPNAASAVPALNRLMKEDEDRTARIWAAAALVRITPKDPRSESALNFLVETRRKGNGRLQEESADALGATRCEPAIAALAEAVLTPETTGFGGRRDHAAKVLGQIGPEAKAAVPALRRALLEQGDELGFSLRQNAAVALGRIGSAAKAALPDLKRASTSADEILRDLAIEAIQRIDNRAPEVPTSNDKQPKFANPESR